MVILRGIRRRLDEAKTSWVEELHTVLWAYRTTPHSTTSESPFRLTYGTKAFIPTELNELTWRTRVRRRDQKRSCFARNSAKTKNSRSPHQEGHQMRIRSWWPRSATKLERFWRRETRGQLGGTLQNPNENWNGSLQSRWSHKRLSSKNLERRKTQEVLHLDCKQIQQTLIYTISSIQRTSCSLVTSNYNGGGKSCHSKSKTFKKDKWNLHNRITLSLVCSHTATTSLLGMSGRTLTRDGWFTPRCVELKLIFSFIRHYSPKHNFGHTFR